MRADDKVEMLVTLACMRGYSKGLYVNYMGNVGEVEIGSSGVIDDGRRYIVRLEGGYMLGVRKGEGERVLRGALEGMLGDMVVKEVSEEYEVRYEKARELLKNYEGYVVGGSVESMGESRGKLYIDLEPYDFFQLLGELGKGVVGVSGEEYEVPDYADVLQFISDECKVDVGMNGFLLKVV